MAKRLSQAQVLARFTEIYGDKYDYSRVNYVNTRTQVEIRCKEHDVWFQQYVGCHLKKRNKCFKCQINVSTVLWSDHPDLLEDIDLRPGKNEGLTFQGISVQVTDLSVGTNRKIDWKCSTCEHEWKSTGNNRLSGKGCPVCVAGGLHSDGRNSMAITHPKLAADYQGDATLVVAGTGKKLDWKCSTCEHEWKTTGDSRKNGTGCPACSNKAIHLDGRNSMAVTHPELAFEYQGDATKVIAGTNRKLPWKCRTCEHEWKSTGTHRSYSKSGCPACVGFLHSDGRNSMANTHPELAAEYQGDASKVIATTEKRLLWKCSTCEHEWRANSRNRVDRNTGCPPCSIKKGVESFKKTNLEKKGSMAETHPELALEYQGDATKIVAFVNRKLLWKCLIVSDNPCGYEWESVASSRASGSGCPCCATTGFQPQKPAYYYVNEILNESGDVIYYKAGISNDWKRRAAKLRRGLPETLTLRPLQQRYFEIGQDALDLENNLLRKAAEEGWKAPPRSFDGGHELFLENPLNHAGL